MYQYVLEKKQFLVLFVAVVELILVLISTRPSGKVHYSHHKHKNGTMNYSLNGDLPKDQAEFHPTYASPNVTEVIQSKFQQSQVDKFCKIFGNKSKTITDRRMLVNDEVKTAICFVPKSGCTTLKVTFLLTLHALPSSVVHDKSKHPNEGLLEKAIHKHSFMSKNKTEKEDIIKDYFKFVMYRNPVERLVSGYLSKIYGHPMIGLKANQPERNWMRLKTYKLVHPVKFKEWKERGAKEAITISFPDFIQYWIKTGGLKIDEHFMTTFDLCSPCKIRYSYYGNFNTYAKDVGVLNDRIHGNMSYLLNPSTRSMGPTISVAPKFYSKITDEQKKRIIDIIATDLHFYYTLFPAERDSHKAIMGVDYDIPPLHS